MEYYPQQMGKRQGGGGGRGGGGSSKKQKFHNHKWTTDAAKNIRALMVTCDQGKEKQCAQEMIAWTTTVVDALYPNLEFDAEEDAGEEVVSQQSVSSALEDELKALKAQGRGGAQGQGKSKPRVSSVTGLPKGIVFLHLRGKVDPVAIARKMIDGLVSERVSQSRYSVRLLPLARTCFSDLAPLEIMAKPIIEEGFRGVPLTATYSVVLERRGGKNERVARDAVVLAMAALVPEGYQVNLKAPDVIVVVQVVGRISGVAVLHKDYVDRKKYNIRSIQDDLRIIEGVVGMPDKVAPTQTELPQQPREQKQGQAEEQQQGEKQENTVPGLAAAANDKAVRVEDVDAGTRKEAEEQPKGVVNRVNVDKVSVDPIGGQDIDGVDDDEEDGGFRLFS
jgi:tRNA acetyltransferase TAN1